MLKKIYFLGSFIIIILFVFLLTSCGETKVSFKLNFIVDSEVYATIDTNGNEVIQMPKDPVKEDYIFDGWYWDQNTWKEQFTAKSLLDAPLSSNMNVYAHFIDDSDLKGTNIEVDGARKLNVDGVGEVFYLSFNHSQIVCKFNDYIKTNPHTLWEISTDITGNNIISSKTVEMNPGDKLYYVYVTDKNGNHDTYFIMLHRNYIFNITFRTGGGTSCNSVQIEEGNYLENIPTSSREGYTFTGWDYDFKNNPIKRDIITNALWNANQYTLYLDANGGIVSQNELIVTYNESYILPTPTREGYRFNYWLDGNNRISNSGICYYTKDTTLKAKWSLNTYTITYDVDGGENNSLNPSTYTYESDTILLKNPSREGYEFLGWSTSENSSPVLNYKINHNSYGDIELKANWKANTDTPYKVEYYKENIENDDYSIMDTKYLYGQTDTKTNAFVNTLEGFTSLSFEQQNINGDGSTVVKIYYKRNKYDIRLYKFKGSNASIVMTRKYGTSVTISADSYDGYTFDGWYDGDKKVTSLITYSFTVPTTDLTYVAKWKANTNTPYKVEYYWQNIDDDNYSLHETKYLAGTTDTETQAKPENYDGFTLINNYSQSNIDGKGTTVIEIYYKRNTYDLSVSSNYENAGFLLNLTGKYKFNKKITMETTTNKGYTFEGWKLNGSFYTNEEIFEYTIGTSDISFEAIYTINKYSISIDNQVEGATILGITSGTEYEYNSNITITISNTNAKYLIWYFNNEVVYYGKSYTFNVPAGNLNIKIISSDTLPSFAYQRDSNVLYFGSYPQSIVNDTELISELNILAGKKPTANYDYNWISYGYRVNGGKKRIMFYQDIDIDNNYTYDYRGVYILEYRPGWALSPYTTEPYTNIDDNGYLINEVYWFKYEPIKWNILKETDGKALIVTDLLLDSQDFYPSRTSTTTFEHNGGKGYTSNYSLSNIRKWLNETFYNTAFNVLQKSLIEFTLVDNSSSSGNNSSYTCSNVSDRLFLLSKTEVNLYSSAFDLTPFSTAYAMCQGLTSSKNWWLRSAVSTQSVCIVNTDGSISNTTAANTFIGIRPALWIKL